MPYWIGICWTWMVIPAPDTGAPVSLLVIDASDLAHVASVHLLRRVPAGFHGSWISDEELS